MITCIIKFFTILNCSIKTIKNYKRINKIKTMERKKWSDTKMKEETGQQVKANELNIDELKGKTIAELNNISSVISVLQATVGLRSTI